MKLFLTHTKNTFEGQREGEIVLALIRRHPYIIITAITGFALLAFSPFALLINYYDYLTNSELLPLAWFLTILFFSLVWHILFYRIMDYLLDTWTITNERIISSQQLGFFRRRVVEAELDRVQDTTVEVMSMIPTLLNFGDIEVQTAGAKEKLFFYQVPSPNKIRELIAKAGKELRSRGSNDKL